jgi:hypothetical protein
MKRIILTEVTGYGWLPTVEDDGKEIYRGEYQVFSLHAFDKADEAMDRLFPSPPISLEKVS